MQLALPSDSKTAYVSRLMIAGVAVAGASLFAMNAPTPAGPQVQHRDVQLAAGELDWSTVISDTEANLADLQTEAAKGSTDLSTALGNVSEHFGTQITDALTGFESGIQNSLLRRLVRRRRRLCLRAVRRHRDATRPPVSPRPTASIGLLSADFQAGNANRRSATSTRTRWR